MKVELEKVFPMPVTADIAWAFLKNIEGVAGCVPGAKITGRREDGRYLGTISVRLGPANLSFKGEIEVRELDAARRTLRLSGKGSDSSGTSGASMDLTARIDALSDTRCNLTGKSEVSMSGKAAAFGGRMMGAVADQILKQFAANFAMQATELASVVAPAADGTDAGTVASTGASSAGAAGGGAMGGTDAAGAAGGRTVGAANAGAVADIAVATGIAGPSPATTFISPPAPQPPSTNQINGLGLLWAVVRDWVRDMFKRKPV